MNAGLRLVLDKVGHDYEALTVLDGISLVVEPGAVTVLVGPSGLCNQLLDHERFKQVTESLSVGEPVGLD